MREYKCIDCNNEVTLFSDGTRGRLPTRCPEHLLLRAYKMQKEYLDKKNEGATLRQKQ